MGSSNKQPVKAKTTLGDDVSEPPFETKELRKKLKELLAQPFEDHTSGKKKSVGSYKFGIYVFYDYDGEPIYVGQTSESLSTRVRRHLTNQRTDAVAMSVLDPFEVCDVALFPLPELKGSSKKVAKKTLDEFEAAIYLKVLAESKFRAVLNEKIPIGPKKKTLPLAIRGRIVSDEVMVTRRHPDVRLARRASTLARLAQIISERKVAPGLRRVLFVQSERLLDLASRRFEHFKGLPDDDEAVSIE